MIILDELDEENLRCILTMQQQGGTMLIDWLEQRTDDELDYALMLLSTIDKKRQEFVNLL